MPVAPFFQNPRNAQSMTLDGLSPDGPAHSHKVYRTHSNKASAQTCTLPYVCAVPTTESWTFLPLHACMCVARKQYKPTAWLKVKHRVSW